MDGLPTELICPVCSQLFQDPHQLPCMHDLCKACLIQLAGEGVGDNTSHVHVECPSCSTAVDFMVISEDDKVIDVCTTASIRPNPILGRLVQQVQQMQSAMQATQQCLEQERQQKLAMEKQLTELRGHLCEEHAEEKMEKNLFCLECKSQICHLCHMTRRHEGHNVISVSLKQEFDEKKDKILERLNTLRDQRNNMCESKVQAEFQLTELQEEYKAVLVQVQDAFGKLHEAVKRKHIEVMAHIKKEGLRVVEAMDQRVWDTDTQVQAMTEMVEEAEKIIEQGYATSSVINGIIKRIEEHEHGIVSPEDTQLYPEDGASSQEVIVIVPKEQKVSDSSKETEEERRSRYEKKRLEKEEEKERKKKAKYEQKKKEKIHFVQTETKLNQMDKEIKKSLSLQNTDEDKCIAIMNELECLNVNMVLLQKNPDIMNTMKKCKKYKGSDKIRMKAEFIYNKFKAMFMTADRESAPPQDRIAEAEQDAIRGAIELSLQEFQKSITPPKEEKAVSCEAYWSIESTKEDSVRLRKNYEVMEERTKDKKEESVNKENVKGTAVVADSDEASSGEDSEAEEVFCDGYDENFLGDEKDRKRLKQMTVSERETELFNRIEKRETLKIRFDIERGLRQSKRRNKRASETPAEHSGQKRQKIIANLDATCADQTCTQANIKTKPDEQKKQGEEREKNPDIGAITQSMSPQPDQDTNTCTETYESPHTRFAPVLELLQKTTDQILQMNP